MFCQNLIETLYKCAGCYLYFLIGNLTQNVKFFNVSNEVKVINVRN